MSNLSFPNSPDFKFYFDIRGIETWQFDQAPDGWLATLIEFAASKNYTALRRTLAESYKFINNAAFICRREFLTYFIAADVVLRIEMRNDDLTHTNIYTGRLKFSDPATENGETGFTVPCIAMDFSQNIDAYDNVPYSLSLEDGINLELTPLQLAETATLLPQAPPDGKIYYDYFVPLQVINNTQNSIDRTVQDIPFSQAESPPNFISYPEFYRSRLVQNLLITGTITGYWIAPLQAGKHLSIGIYDGSGAEIYPLFSVVTDGSNQPHPFTVTLNRSLSTPPEDRLYLYMSGEGGNDCGIIITDGQIDLSYKTITPPTMCKALTGEQVFAKLLQKMNPNRNSLPNAPVPYQSQLLKTTLANLVYTSSDSIRAAKGSIFKPGNTIGQGIYQVISVADVNYNGIIYHTGQQFSFDGTLTFTGGYVQKIQSIYVGAVLNAGDNLNPGGSYLVSGISGTLNYNGVTYTIGTIFTYILGQDTFTVSDPSIFVKQIAEDAQLIITFDTLFKDVRAKMGGNACMGVFRGKVFIEDLTMCYQAGAGTVDLGRVSLEWKQNPASDMLYANFKGGYADQQYDALNGSKEVNSAVQYTTGIMLSPTQQTPGDYANNLDLVSTVRSDPYGIESVRITQNDTAASRSNNDTFAIWINPVPVDTVPFTYYHPALAGDSLSLLTGVDEGYYNFFLSPKSNLLRGAPYLASIFWNMADYPITVASAVKNDRMVYVTNAGVRVAESEPVLVSQLGPGLFIPMYFKGPQSIGYDVLKQLDTNPYADIKFTVKDVELRGFINTFKINPATNAPQDITLLLSWGQDLSGLITI
jgi:hypothetical protein